ncbi:MAG TPA: OsmC family protein [Armatimonadota bacterium]|nr:OsmC family protein [Armatimonadota bacterium]
MKITSRFMSGQRFASDIRGHTVITDVTREMGGTDAGPMPPELVATALGTCVGIYAVAFCQKHGIAAEGMVVHTEWEKVPNPDRIGRMRVCVEVPAGIPEHKHAAFMRTVQECMVHNTLCQMPQVTLCLGGA